MRVLFLILLLGTWGRASELVTYADVELVNTHWADGDSFRVRFADGQELTVRLYGADCMEWHISDESVARRLRAQRRYFGISDFGGDAGSSIELAKSLGEAAAVTVRSVLADPFTVHTAHADGRGDPRFRRVYAFVTTSEGKDLATELVSQGLARAYGITRSTPDGQTRDEYRESLQDAELVAARAGRGIWAYTDWQTLQQERNLQRREDREQQLAMGTALPTESVELNTATKRQLMSIPGVGEVTASAILEGRPYGSVEELIRVKGIGRKTLEDLRSWVFIRPEPDDDPQRPPLRNLPGK
jgi:endonuclease YncB( thermonuclease family)